MQDIIKINIRALSQEDRDKLEALLLANCLDVGDDINGEALLMLRQFEDQ